MSQAARSLEAPRIVTREQGCVCCGSDDAEPVGAGVDFEYGTCSNEFHFVACRGCGHHYLRELPDPAELGRIYPPDYANYDAERGASLAFRVKARLDRRWLRALSRHAPPVRAVLDVGCADGRTLALCREVHPGLERADGVEISEDAARAARAAGFEVQVASIEDAVLPEETYDLVLMQQVIEHVYRPDRVCAKLAAALRPGGLLVLETPTTDCLDFRWFRRRYWGGYHVPRHFNLFCERSLRRLGERAGLAWVATGYRPQPIHWIWTLHHWLVEHGAPAWLHRRFHIENVPLMGAFTLVEMAAGLATGVQSNLQLVLRRPPAEAS